MRGSLIITLALLGLTGCVVEHPAPQPVSTTYVTPPTTAYTPVPPGTIVAPVPVAPSTTTTVIHNP